MIMTFSLSILGDVPLTGKELIRHISKSDLLEIMFQYPPWN